MSIELSLEDVKRVASHFGFVIEVTTRYKNDIFLLIIKHFMFFHTQYLSVTFAERKNN